MARVRPTSTQRLQKSASVSQEHCLSENDRLIKEGMEVALNQASTGFAGMGQLVSILGSLAVELCHNCAVIA